jgi:hypothetical protein
MKTSEELNKEVEYRGFKYFIEIELNTEINASGLKCFREKSCVVTIFFDNTNKYEFFRRDHVHEDSLVNHLLRREKYMEKYIDSKCDSEIIKQLINLGFKK